MTTYTAIQIPSYKLLPEFTGSNLPKTVSFFGARPEPFDAYEVVYSPSIEINSNGRITYSNFFYGYRIETMEQAEETANKLNA